MTTRIIALLLLVLSSTAEDWPQFRGPGGQGHSTETGLPVEWSESKNIAWKVAVPGMGWSSPVVAGGRVWLTTSVDGKNGSSLRALAYDVENGRELVNAEVFSIDESGFTQNPKNSDASPTPIVDGDRVYLHFGANGTAAISTSGTVIWKTRLPYQSQHGDGGSPALFGDLLIISCDGDDEAYVIALDRKTGKTRWKTPRRQPSAQAYSTPLVIRSGERDQLVSVGAFRTTAYDPMSGKEIWRVGYPDGFSNVPRPVFANGLIYIATGFQQPALIAVRTDGTGDVSKTHVAWRLQRAAPHTPSPLLVGGELYVVNDLGIVTCLNAGTGEQIWIQRIGGNHSASPVFAEGRIYFLSEEGVSTVIAAGKEYKKIATNALDGATLASMAISNGSIFVRSDANLYRIREMGETR